jgi:hypothetical protein
MDAYCPERAGMDAGAEAETAFLAAFGASVELDGGTAIGAAVERKG